MTNEEIVKLIQEGQSELVLTLWEQIKKYVGFMAAKWNREEYYDDMVQEGFIALMPAISGYSYDKGMTFLNYYSSYYLHEAFTTAIYGSRNQQQKNDPINNSVSLDMPVGDEEDSFTLMDIIIDPYAELPFHGIEEDDFWHDIGEIIQAGIASMTNERQRDIMQYHYENDSTFTGGWKRLALGITYTGYKSLYDAGVKYLRRYLIKESKRHERPNIALREYIESRMRTQIYYSGGVGAYRNNGFTSNTERIALDQAEFEEKTARFNRELKELKRVAGIK